MKEIVKSAYIKALVFMLIAFFCGFFWGWAWGTHYSNKKIKNFLSKKPEDRHEFIVNKLDKKLNLSPEQFRAIDNIVKMGLRDIHAARAKCLPEEEAIFRRGLEEIEKVLSDEQKGRWEGVKNKLIRDWERIRRFHPEGPPPHPPPTPHRRPED